MSSIAPGSIVACRATAAIIYVVELKADDDIHWNLRSARTGHPGRADFSRRQCGQADIIEVRSAGFDGIPNEVARDLGDEIAPIAHCAAAVRGREVNGIPPRRRFLAGNRTRIEHSKSDAGAAN